MGANAIATEPPCDLWCSPLGQLRRYSTIFQMIGPTFLAGPVAEHVAGLPTILQHFAIGPAPR